MDHQPGVHAGVIAVVIVFGKEVGWFYFFICFLDLCPDDVVLLCGASAVFVREAYNAGHVLGEKTVVCV